MNVKIINLRPEKNFVKFSTNYFISRRNRACSVPTKIKTNVRILFLRSQFVTKK